MGKPSTRTKSVKSHWGLGVRGRDAEFPSAPIRVSEDAQPKMIDANTARQFDFGRKDRTKLPERPSTSGGPVKSSMRKNAEKRDTKDDLHFNLLAAQGKVTTFYNFPLPGTLPSPAYTPKSSPPLLAKSLAPRSNTPDSMESRQVALDVVPTEIGMALGSPSHQPTSWHQPRTAIDSNIVSPSPDHDSAIDGGTDQPAPLKHKASKWKILGGLFGGKKPSNSQTFYQLQPETSHQTTIESDYIDFGEPPSVSEKKPPKPRGRGRTNSERKTNTKKPDMKRANTVPVAFDFQEQNGITRPPMPEIIVDDRSTLDGIYQPAQAHVNNSGPLLDVTIPSVQMERYSIMFGSVLQKPIGIASSSPLLARRQATLDRLKTVNEELAAKERELEEKARQLRPRRATSPQPTKSPAFSLFPSTPSRLTVRETPSPSAHRTLQRSNTSPAALSPSRPTFAPQDDNEMHARLVGPAPHIPVDPRPNHQIPSRNNRELKELKIKAPPKLTASPNPQEVNRSWSPEGSHLTIDSPISERGQDDVSDIALFPMKPQLEEPSWQMVMPRKHQASTSVSGSTTSHSDGHSTSTSASSISTTSTPQDTTPKHVIIQPAPARRNRSATTSAATRPRPSEVSNSAFGSPLTTSSSPVPNPLVPPKTQTQEEDDEREERLKSAANISIARQISVSRQQRQMLIPIKKSSLSSLNKSPNPNFPSPSFNIARVASPLGVVAAAAESPTAGKSGNLLLKPERKNTAERLVQASASPITPTLVVVGEAKGDAERSWGGNMMTNGSAHEAKGSVEIMVGMAIGGLVELGNRKSERVVVEDVERKSAGMTYLH